MFSFDFVKKVNQATNIYDLVSRYVDLQKSGKGYKGKCPFHDDNDPSFSVSLELNIAKCFSCNEGGNPVQFLSKIESISLKDAVIKLAKEAGIPLEKDSLGISEKLFPMYELMDSISEIYNGILTLTEEGKKGLTYLEKRGINIEDIKRYKIGYAPSTNTVINYLKTFGKSYSDALTLGLIKKDKNGEFVDTFNDRIIFPITDINGSIISFSGRSINSTEKTKYLNLINSPLFQKGDVLYNLANIKKNDKIYIVEGFFDVISHSKAGFPNTLATMGVALTAKHIETIKSLTNYLTLVFDGDNAGMATNVEQATNLINHFEYLDVINLYDPQSKKTDPDSLYQSDPQNYSKHILDKTIDGYSFIYQNLLLETNLDDNNSVSILIAKLDNLLLSASSFIRNKIANDLSAKVKAPIVFTTPSIKKKQQHIQEKIVVDTSKKPQDFYEKQFCSYQENIIKLENQILKGLINPQFGKKLLDFYTSNTEERFVLTFSKAGGQLFFLLKDYYKSNEYYNNDQVIAFAEDKPLFNIYIEAITNKIHEINAFQFTPSYDALRKQFDNYSQKIECFDNLCKLFKELQSIENTCNLSDNLTKAKLKDIHTNIKKTSKQLKKLEIERRKNETKG